MIRVIVGGLVFFFKQKTAYEMLRSLVGSEMCIRDRYYKILKWNKKGMKYGDSMAETKRWIIDQIESQSPLVEVIHKKWIQSIDVDLEKRTGKSEWLYLVETCNMLLWFRAEVDDFNIKIIDIVDTNIIKYPSCNCFDV